MFNLSFSDRHLTHSRPQPALIPALLALALFLPSGLGLGVEIGKLAPDFKLKNTDGKTVSLSSFRKKTVVLEWTSSTCPFVVDHYERGTMVKLANELKKRGVVWLAIDSTHYNTPKKTKDWSARWGIPFPTLHDPAGTVGKLYNARTTPHMYVVDKKGRLAYQGAIDSAADKKVPGYRNYVSEAVDAILAGKKPPLAETKPYGCSVKYLQM